MVCFQSLFANICKAETGQNMLKTLVSAPQMVQEQLLPILHKQASENKQHFPNLLYYLPLHCSQRPHVEALTPTRGRAKSHTLAQNSLVAASGAWPHVGSLLSHVANPPYLESEQAACRHFTHQITINHPLKHSPACNNWKSAPGSLWLAPPETWPIISQSPCGIHSTFEISKQHLQAFPSAHAAADFA